MPIRVLVLTTYLLGSIEQHPYDYCTHDIATSYEYLHMLHFQNEWR